MCAGTRDEGGVVAAYILTATNVSPSYVSTGDAAAESRQSSGPLLDEDATAGNGLANTSSGSSAAPGDWRMLPAIYTPFLLSDAADPSAEDTAAGILLQS